MTLDGFIQAQEHKIRWTLAKFYPKPTPVLPEGDVALSCGTEYAWTYGCRCDQCKRGYQQRRSRRNRLKNKLRAQAYRAACKARQRARDTERLAEVRHES